MKEYQFKKYKLSPDEEIWLSELLKLNFAKYDSRQIKVGLSNKLSKGFDPTKIDRRLCNNDGLTLLGLWYINPGNSLIELTEETLNFIKLYIRNNPTIDSINHNTLASKLSIPPEEAQIILKFLHDLHFFGSATGAPNKIGFYQVGFANDPKGFDKILYFENLDETLEEYFIVNIPYPNQVIMSPSSLSGSTLAIISDVWITIHTEYEITKPEVEAKINFVPEEYKREIIFRDIEQSYLLVQQGFFKPAVILTGSVIEELLRLYLLAKSVKPENNSFDEYIKSCETNNLITKGIKGLTDSIRHFRNLVHLEKEDIPKRTITKANAKSAVASLFSIIHDFQ
ncbi:hypothetical protein [Clostridium sp.]|uniref:hypothetical protein n=1 Tax=Clostridium sp. TaxID=1506 RepID=UPI00284CB601|nr:hypothetical protein [Clostridium sp.]MDR3596565.1 hypothetical protein [Clostridium sp.]